MLTKPSLNLPDSPMPTWPTKSSDMCSWTGLQLPHTSHATYLLPASSLFLFQLAVQHVLCCSCSWAAAGSWLAGTPGMCRKAWLLPLLAPGCFLLGLLAFKHVAWLSKWWLVCVVCWQLATCMACLVPTTKGSSWIEKEDRTGKRKGGGKEKGTRWIG